MLRIILHIQLLYLLQSTKIKQISNRNDITKNSKEILRNQYKENTTVYRISLFAGTISQFKKRDISEYCINFPD